MTEPLARLLIALRDELSDWAATSERLEVVIGDVLTGRKLTPDEIEAVQALDGLSQHLRQLSQLCGDIGVGREHDRGAGEALIQTAVDRLNLGGLGGRLAPDHAPVLRPTAGEAELW